MSPEDLHARQGKRRDEVTGFVLVSPPFRAQAGVAVVVGAAAGGAERGGVVAGVAVVAGAAAGGAGRGIVVAGVAVERGGQLVRSTTLDDQRLR